MGDCYETAVVISKAVTDKLQELTGELRPEIIKNFEEFYTNYLLETALGPNPKDSSRSAAVNAPEIIEEIKELTKNLEIEPSYEGMHIYFYARAIGLQKEDIEKMLTEENINKIGVDELIDDIDMYKELPERKLEIFLRRDYNEMSSRIIMKALLSFKKNGKIPENLIDNMKGVYSYKE